MGLGKGDRREFQWIATHLSLIRRELTQLFIRPVTLLCGLRLAQALFRRVGETEEWGSGFMTAVGSQGLAPGATTQPITMRSERGYTGSDQSRQEMLQNSHFVDGTVELQAKYASSQWARLGTYPITRQVITK